ncbi:MAG: glycosyltransferase [Butyrivibrio sp.]|nr:glycosyltransferase [Butyrivibrio sp.]
MSTGATRVQTLVAALNSDTDSLPGRMHLQCDTIIVNQTDHYAYEAWSLPADAGAAQLRIWHCAERGVGLSRNTALQRAGGELVQFADEDIVYDEGYPARIASAFDAHPEADVLLFNVRAVPGRETYHITDYGRVRIWNSGRYPAYAICARREALIRARVGFSLLYGGGARYSNGEDSLFLRDCLRAGLRIYRIPVSLGHEEPRSGTGAGEIPASTWFEGYTNRFYRDRGVLYQDLYGWLAAPMSLRFLLAHPAVRGGRSVGACFGLMREGIRTARRRVPEGS